MRLVSTIFTCLVVAALAAAVKADDAPKRSPELQVLDRFVGGHTFSPLDALLSNGIRGALLAQRLPNLLVGRFFWEGGPHLLDVIVVVDGLRVIGLGFWASSALPW